MSTATATTPRGRQLTLPNLDCVRVVLLGDSAGRVHWTVRQWPHERVRGCYYVECVHYSGAKCLFPGYGYSPAGAAAAVEEAIRNAAGWQVLSDTLSAARGCSGG
jgi:hypothetical protein